MDEVGIKAELEDVVAVHPAHGFGELVAVFVGERARGMVAGVPKVKPVESASTADGGRKAVGADRFAGCGRLRQLEFEVAAPGVAQLIDGVIGRGLR